MEFQKENATGYIPDEVTLEEAVERTTHLAIGAHQDDLEIMAYHGILECYKNPEKWFAGVVCTDGRNSPRAGDFADFSDQLMVGIRSEEQMDAADIGKYSAVFQLDYLGDEVRDIADNRLLEDLVKVLENLQPEVLYTHNPADKHETHIAVVSATIKAVRKLPKEKRPKFVYGCEVWRNLDWLPDEDKVALDVSGNNELALNLISAFVSQISGGKNYVDAAIGRLRANATFHQSHQVDSATDISFAIDLTPVCNDESIDIMEYIGAYIDKFADDVKSKLTKYFG